MALAALDPYGRILINPYLYVDNNPVISVDPSGLLAITPGLLLTLLRLALTNPALLTTLLQPHLLPLGIVVGVGFLLCLTIGFAKCGSDAADCAVRVVVKARQCASRACTEPLSAADEAECAARYATALGTACEGLTLSCVLSCGLASGPKALSCRPKNLCRDLCCQEDFDECPEADDKTKADCEGKKLCRVKGKPYGCMWFSLFDKPACQCKGRI
jgi:hypothetical protein